MFAKCKCCNVNVIFSFLVMPWISYFVCWATQIFWKQCIKRKKWICFFYFLFDEHGKLHWFCLLGNVKMLYHFFNSFVVLFCPFLVLSSLNHTEKRETRVQNGMKGSDYRIQIFGSTIAVILQWHDNHVELSVFVHVEVILQCLVAVVQEGTQCARWGELGKSCCPADFNKACKTVLCLKLLKDPVLPWHLLLSPSRSLCCFSLDLGTDWFDQYFFFFASELCFPFIPCRAVFYGLTMSEKF